MHDFFANTFFHLNLFYYDLPLRPINCNTTGLSQRQWNRKVIFKISTYRRIYVIESYLVLLARGSVSSR